LLSRIFEKIVMAKKTISDKVAKEKCIEYLKLKGYSNVQIASPKEGCDILAFNAQGEIFYFEVKYSSKKSGKFFGTVMLTELHKAICYPDNYFFILCRGNTEQSLEHWFFKIFSVKEFIGKCTLTTPIFHYHYSESYEISFKKETIIATKNLIEKMWQDFLIWKKTQ
jgi:hypothetical protein